MPNPEFEGEESYGHDELEAMIYAADMAKYLKDEFPWLSSTVVEIEESYNSIHAKADMLDGLFEDTNSYFDEIRSTIGEDTYSEWDNPELRANPWTVYESESPRHRYQELGSWLVGASLGLGVVSVTHVVVSGQYGQALDYGLVGLTLYGAGRMLNN